MVMGNGALAGLVAITAGCSVIYPWGAIIVGIIAGMLYCLGSYVSIKLHVCHSMSPASLLSYNLGEFAAHEAVINLIHIACCA